MNKNKLLQTLLENKILKKNWPDLDTSKLNTNTVVNQRNKPLKLLGLLLNTENTAGMIKNQIETIIK